MVKFYVGSNFLSLQKQFYSKIICLKNVSTVGGNSIFVISDIDAVSTDSTNETARI